MFHPHLFIRQEHKLMSKTVVPNRLHCIYKCLHLMCTLCNSPYNVHFMQRRAAHRLLWRARQRRKKGETTAESNLGDSANLPAPSFLHSAEYYSASAAFIRPFCVHLINPPSHPPSYIIVSLTFSTAVQTVDLVWIEQTLHCIALALHNM